MSVAAGAPTMKRGDGDLRQAFLGAPYLVPDTFHRGDGAVPRCGPAGGSGHCQGGRGVPGWRDGAGIAPADVKTMKRGGPRASEQDANLHLGSAPVAVTWAEAAITKANRGGSITSRARRSIAIPRRSADGCPDCGGPCGHSRRDVRVSVGGARRVPAGWWDARYRCEGSPSSQNQRTPEATARAGCSSDPVGRA